MKKILFALALLLTIGAIEASAQSNPPLSNKRIRMKGQAAAPTPDPPTGYYNIWVDSGSGNLYITNSAGTDTPVGAGISGLTDNVIPQANGTTAIENSKMTASGTNSGTWTLYDDTAVTGSTLLTLRNGPGQSGPVMQAQGDGVEIIGQSASNRFSAYMYGVSIGYPSIGAGELRVGTSTGATAIYSNTLGLSSSVHLRWSSGDVTAVATDGGILRDGVGILKLTNGSTGQGGIGLSDAATNTVSDALILRHATSGTAAASFGTGLLFQGEDAAGNMQDMASIDAVYTDATNGSEDSKLVLSAHNAGAEEEAFSVDVANGFSYLRSPGVTVIEGAGDTVLMSTGGYLRFDANGYTQWTIANAILSPSANDAYDFGAPSLEIRNAYVSTSIQGTRTKTLTDNTITDVVQISSTAGADANGVTAGHVSYTIIASDATTDKVQTEVGQLPFLLVNENGTVTVTLGTVGVTAIDSAGGAALSNTFASSVSGTNAKIRVTSDYDQATLTGAVTHTIEYRVYIDSGTATVTPQ